MLARSLGPERPRTETGRGRRGPPATSARPEAPIFAFFLAFLGGVLVMVEGFALVAGGGEPFAVVSGLPTSVTPELGGIGIAVGIGTVAVGFVAQERSSQRRTAGGILIGLGALSSVSGGGFLLGLLLSVAGGAIALFLPPTDLYDPGGPEAERAPPGQ